VIQARALRGCRRGAVFPAEPGRDWEIYQNNRVSKNSPQAFGDRSFQGFVPGALKRRGSWTSGASFRRGDRIGRTASLDASVADYDSAARNTCRPTSPPTTCRSGSIQEQLGFTRAKRLNYSRTPSRSRRSDSTRARCRNWMSPRRHAQHSPIPSPLFPQLQDSLRQAKLALCVLLGRTPVGVGGPNLPGEGAPFPRRQRKIALGIPADLLRRRTRTFAAPNDSPAAPLGANGCREPRRSFIPSVTIKRHQVDFHSSTFQSPGFFRRIFTISWMPIRSKVSSASTSTGRSSTMAEFRTTFRAADSRFQEAAVAYQQTVLQAASEGRRGLVNPFFEARRNRRLSLDESVTSAPALRRPFR